MRLIAEARRAVRTRPVLAPLRDLYHLCRTKITEGKRLPARVRYGCYEAKRLRQFRGLHRGRQRCFLIGNGPSLLRQDLSVLRDELVFVTNRFVLHPQCDAIAPTYYCASDTKFLRDQMTPHVADLLRAQLPEMVSFLPYEVKPVIRRGTVFPVAGTFFLRADGRRAWREKTMSLDPSRGITVGESVIIDFCLPLAFYMGVSDVFLVGCDTDYGLDRAADYSQGYFYDVKDTPPYATVERHQTVWYRQVVGAFEVAKTIFEANGRRIYNATDGGKLDVFERMSLADAVKHAGPRA